MIATPMGENPSKRAIAFAKEAWLGNSNACEVILRNATSKVGRADNRWHLKSELLEALLEYERERWRYHSGQYDDGKPARAEPELFEILWRSGGPDLQKMILLSAARFYETRMKVEVEKSEPRIRLLREQADAIERRNE